MEVFVERPNPEDAPPRPRPGAPGPVPLSGARLAELATRLAHGYYDRDEVRAIIVRRLVAREHSC